MPKHVLRFLLSAIFILLLPFIGQCQISVPKWVDDIGGPGSSSIPSSVKIDKQNNVYVAGFFSGTVDFDPSPGVYNLNSVSGSIDTYIAKYTTDGKLIWAVSFGGDGSEQVNDMALDANGNATVTGQYNSTSVNVGGVFTLNNNGDNDAFIVKLDANGKFLWGKSVGGFSTDYGDRVSTDASGNVIEVVKYQATVVVGGNTYASQGSFNGLIIKYDPSGNLLWSVNLADPGDCEARAVTVDSNNDIVVAGSFSGNDNFNPLGTAYNLNGNGNSMFVAKYDPSGNLIWATSAAGDAVNSNIYLCVNSSNDIFLDGPFIGQLGFNSGNTTINSVGQQDVFLAKYKTDGTFQWVKDVGGAGAAVYNYGIVSSKDDNIYISGYFSGNVDFDPSPTSATFVADHGNQDLYFAKYDSDGNYKWAFSAGSPNCGQTLGRNLAVDGNNDVLLVGSFCSTVNFDASKCTNYNLTAQSSDRDSFVAKYTQGKPTASSEITAFSVPQQVSPAVIDQTKLQITVMVAQGTNVSALVPNVVISGGQTLSPASGTPQNFTGPVSYNLSSSCASLNYTVNVAYQSATVVTPPSNPMVCATTGDDGTTNITGSINTYFPPLGNVNLAAGTNSITLAAVPAVDPYGNSFGTVPIKPGDLLLIIQMQDATINFSNSTLYGANSATSGADGLGGTGFTDLGNSGKFEYVIATSSVPLTGGTLTFKGSGASNGTVYSYTNADPTASRGKRSFQIIRLPQYSNLKLSSNISPPPFNGSAGGIIAFNVGGNMDFNGHTIDVSARGFRGGYSLIKVTQGINLNDLYVANSDDNRVSGKGEGTAGTPRYMWDGYNQVDNIVEGLPGGSGGRGAPANAAGGGNDVNSGGGGGGNGGSGGVGGYGYQVDPGTFPNGGRPGSVSFTGSVDVTRLVMGGGGGGGHANDALTGVKGGVGGGVVIITAQSVTGNGTILANGGDGAPGAYGSHPDGSGGGGAGGTIFVKLSNPNPAATITMHAIGGKGGNTQHDDPVNDGVQPHGPGGGGGGGQIIYAILSGSVNTDVSPGKSGKTNNGNGITHNAADGYPGVTSKFTIASLPPYLQGSSGTCYPILVTTMKVTNPGHVNAPGDNVTYVISITNKASGGNAGGVQAYAAIPSGIAFSSATATYTGAASGPATLSNQGTANAPIFGDFNIPAGETVTITMITKIACLPSGTYNSNAEAIYYDPTRLSTDPNRRITAATNAFTGSNTTYQAGPAGPVPGSNYNGTSSTAEDVIVAGNGVTNNLITAPAITNFCTSGDPAIITGSTPTGGNGTYSYQWQSSTDNVTFADITGATAKDYDPPVINATTYYRRTVISGSCAVPLNSNVVTLTVNGVAANNLITAPSITTFCTSGDPAVITGSTPTGGNGAYSYQWQNSADGVTFANIAGANAKDYDSPVINATTYFQRVVTSGACTTPVVSNVVKMTVTVSPAVGNNVITAPAVIGFCTSGDPAVIAGSTPTGGSGTYNYQWQSSADNVTFTDITGATAKDYDSPVINTTTYFRRTVTSGTCSAPLASNVVTINITPVAANNTITPPAVTSFCTSGTPAIITGSTPTGGNGTYNYQWQNSADGVTFANITGATAKDYTPSAISATTYYQRQVTSGNCATPLVSNVVKLTVVAAASPLANDVITAPSTTSFCSTAPASTITGSTPTGGSAAYTYQWQSSLDNVTFTNISGATAKDLLTASANVTTYYRRTVSSGTCDVPVNSNVVALTILSPVTNNVITAPAVTSFCTSGDPALITGSTPTSSGGPFAYQWQISVDNLTFVDIPGATAKDYNPPVINATTYYRRIVTSSTCTTPVISNVVTITVVTLVANNTITAPSVTAFCAAGTPAVITGSTPTGGDGSYAYEWQSSTDNITFANITGATARDYAPTAISTTTYYQRIVTSGGCSTPLTSNVVQITIIPAVANNVITAPAITSFCSNGDPSVITGSTPTGGNGTYAYQWQSSADNITFADITGATAKDYDPVPVSATTYYRRTVTSGVCNIPAVSNVVPITIIPAVANNAITAPSITSFCTSGDPSVIIGSTPTGGNGTYTYQWQGSADNVTFTNIAGATAKDFDPAPITATTYYRRTVTSGVCNTPLVSNVVTVTVTTAIIPVANNVLTAPSVTGFCVSGDPSVITGSTPTGGIGTYNYQWQSSTDNVTFADITGATAKDYDPTAINVTTYYRRNVTSGTCATPVVSNVIIIAIQPALANNSITPPAVTSFCTTGNPSVIAGSTPTGGNGTYAYQWQTSVDNATFTDINGAAARDYDPPVITATTYYRRLVSSVVCNVPLASNTVSFIINPSPVTPVPVTSPVLICAGNSATLAVASPQQGLTYNWYDSPAKTNHLFTGVTYVTNPVNASTTFYVEAVSSTCSSLSLATVQVNVTSAPATPLVVNSQVPACSGSMATLSISNPQNGLTYNWYTSATGGSPVYTGVDFVTPPVTANTTYYAEAANNGGCSSPTRAAVNVTMNPLPQLTVLGAAVCPGSNAVLTASSSTANVTVNWYANAAGGSIIHTGNTYTTSAVTANTNYYAEAVNNTTGCVSASRSLVQATLLEQLTAPVVSVAATTTSSITFQWDAVDGAIGYQVSIDNGQTFSDPSSGPDGLTNTITGLQPNQSVTIIVRATGVLSCQLSTSSTAVTAEAVSALGDHIYVANAFTPNGDGKNEIVYVHSDNIKSLKFYVYDQWGELIFTSLSQQNGWDGTYRGAKEPVGVYVYYLEAIMYSGDKVTKKGSITLLR